jgi:phage gpG-like protein
MLAKAGNLAKPLKEIGFLGAQEMKTNIAQGGRPTKWTPSVRVQRHGGQTLRNTGELMNSMGFEVQTSGNPSVAIGPTASHIPEAGKKILAFGKPFPWRKGQKKGGAFPARNYTFIPDETWRTFGDVVKQHLLGP